MDLAQGRRAGGSEERERSCDAAGRSAAARARRCRTSRPGGARPGDREAARRRRRILPRVAWTAVGRGGSRAVRHAVWCAPHRGGGRPGSRIRGIPRMLWTLVQVVLRCLCGARVIYPSRTADRVDARHPAVQDSPRQRASPAPCAVRAVSHFSGRTPRNSSERRPRNTNSRDPGPFVVPPPTRSMLDPSEGGQGPAPLGGPGRRPSGAPRRASRGGRLASEGECRSPHQLSRPERGRSCSAARDRSRRDRPGRRTG